MKNLFASKKGIIGDVVSGLVFLFIFGVVIIFAYLFVYEFNNTLATTDVYTDQMGETASDFLGGLALFDYMMIIFMAVVIVGIGVASYRLASAPVYFIIVLVGSGFLGFISFFFNYVFAQIASNSVFTAVLVFFPRTLLICTNLHWIALVSLVVGSISMYGKNEQGQYT